MEKPTPTYSRIFWDWHGVLGTNGFWYKSVRQNPEIKKLTDYIFTNPDHVNSWMKNNLSLKQLLQQSKANITYKALLEAFDDDWSDDLMINTPLIEKIKQSSPDARHYIITDNMDVFSNYIHTNKLILNNFEAVFNSSDVGKLKSDTPGLFEHVLASLKMSSFSGTLFLDDSLDNCRRFEKLGGSAIQVIEGKVKF